MLIPVFADARYLITRQRRFTPYLECGAGYAFAPGKNSNGGFYLNPSVGIQYAFHKNTKFLFAMGYELQELDRLKEYTDNYFTAGFNEELRHHSLMFRIGIIF